MNNTWQVVVMEFRPPSVYKRAEGLLLEAYRSLSLGHQPVGGLKGDSADSLPCGWHIEQRKKGRGVSTAAKISCCVTSQ